MSDQSHLIFMDQSETDSIASKLACITVLEISLLVWCTDVEIVILEVSFLNDMAMKKVRRDSPFFQVYAANESTIVHIRQLVYKDGYIILMR